jgi:hypothetical protein
MENAFGSTSIARRIVEYTVVEPVALDLTVFVLVLAVGQRQFASQATSIKDERFTWKRKGGLAGLFEIAGQKGLKASVDRRRVLSKETLLFRKRREDLCRYLHDLRANALPRNTKP